MAWDPDNPRGNRPINLGDDDIRANFAALEVALGAEHDFAAGSPAGRHKFLRDTEGNADAIATWQQGSLYFNRNDLIANLTVARLASAAGAGQWEHVWPYNDWPELTQFQTWVAKTGTPLTWTGEEGHYFSSTLAANTTLDAPTLPTAAFSGRASTYTWRLQQAAAGGPYTIAFSGNFRWLHSIAPVMPTAASEILLITMTRAPDDYLEGSWAIIA